METKRTHEELTEILDRNTVWIENCDSKTSILLGGFGIIVGILLATDYVSKFLMIYRYMVSHVNFWSVVYLLLCVLGIGLIFSGCVCWFEVLFARVNINEFADKGIKPESLIFFSSIAKFKSLSAYKQKLQRSDTAQMVDDLISQIYICSIICDKKFKYYKLGLFLTSIGTVLVIGLIITGLLIA